jgi:hypothetical protein
MLEIMAVVPLLLILGCFPSTLILRPVAHIGVLHYFVPLVNIRENPATHMRKQTVVKDFHRLNS